MIKYKDWMWQLEDSNNKMDYSKPIKEEWLKVKEQYKISQAKYKSISDKLGSIRINAKYLRWETSNWRIWCSIPINRDRNYPNNWSPKCMKWIKWNQSSWEYKLNHSKWKNLSQIILIWKYLMINLESIECSYRRALKSLKNSQIRISWIR